MADLEYYLKTWKLENPSDLAATPTSSLYKVRFQSQDAVLKIFTPRGKPEAIHGAIALSCFAGRGAILLLDSDEGAQLLSYADGLPLADLVGQGHDAEATEVICSVIKQLHGYSGAFPKLPSLSETFQPLFERAKKEKKDSILIAGARLAEKLLGTERDRVLLHGDLHHQNILNRSGKGWIAIDPKGLVGERTYDLANIFYNPGELPELITTKKRVAAIARTCSQALDLEEKRILDFAFAYGCLSACWALEGGENPEQRMRIAKLIREGR